MQQEAGRAPEPIWMLSVRLFTNMQFGVSKEIFSNACWNSDMTVQLNIYTVT
jgi:hypothetical protein